MLQSLSIFSCIFTLRNLNNNNNRRLLIISFHVKIT